MPIYRYSCSKCGSTKRVSITRGMDKVDCCSECGGDMARLIGAPMVRSMETADGYRNKRIVDGVDKMVDERASDHFKKHELPRLIADKGEQWAKDQGFIDNDGRPV